MTRIEVYIKLPSGSTTSVVLAGTDQVMRIYEHVATEVGLAVDRVKIKYTGKVLNQKHTLSYLGVRSETILKAELIQEKNLNVFVKTPSGKTLQLEISNLDNVRSIQMQIEEKEGISIKQQILKLGSVRVGPSERLVDAGISEEAVLHLHLKPIDSPSKSKESVAARSPDTDTENEDERVDEDNLLNKEEVLGSFDAAGRAVEVIFTFDTTGSMYSCLEQVRKKLRDSAKQLLQDIPGIRIGIMALGDYCDYSTYVVRYVDLTSDVDQLVDFVMHVPATSGGDSPEAYEWALHKAQQMDWSEDSAKALVMIGDNCPHPPSYTDQNINWHDELGILKGMGVKVYGVKAMNSAESYSFYKELADRTGGCFINFSNFSIITEMFLAVCYREAAPEQLEAYCEAVEEEGGMTEEVKDMLNQVREAPAPPQEREQSQNYVAMAWWDPALDHGSPDYSYDSATDTWGPINYQHSGISASLASGRHFKRISPALTKRSKGCNKCSIM